MSYGETVYFIAFHKPLHLGFTSNAHYVAPALPSFQVEQTIAAQTLAPGGTQTVTVSAKSDQSTQGYIEVWITSPANKQVYRSSIDGNPLQFVRDTSQTHTYSYTIPQSIPKGIYTVSITITSPDTFTDYYVKPNFVTFTVS